MEDKTRYTTFRAAMTIVASAFGGGTGIMGNIYAISQLKLIGYLLFSFISFVLFYLTIQFLCVSSELSKQPYIHQLSYSFLGGRYGSLFTRVFVIIGNWSVVVTLIQIFADFLPPILCSILNTNHSIFLSRWFAVLVGLVLISPWIIVKDISHLGNLSITCFLFVLIPVIILLCNGIIAISTHQISPSVEWYTLSIQEIFIGIANMSWCWCCQYNVLPVYATLISGHNKGKQMTTVTWTAGCVILFCYFLSGLSVYFVWGNTINKDFITNLDANDANYVFYLPQWLAGLSQLLICIASFISSPIFIIEARVNLHSVIMQLYQSCNGIEIEDGGNRETIVLTALHVQENVSLMESESDNEQVSMDLHRSDPINESICFRIFEGGFLCLSAAAVALFISDVKFVFSINGATYAVYIAYLLPSIVYHRAIDKLHSTQNTSATKYQNMLRFMSKNIFVYGIIVGVIGIIIVIAWY
eukprot:34585_1